MGFEPVRFGLIPFSDVISADDPDELLRPAVPFGSTKLIRLWLEDKTPLHWRVFYDTAKFDWRTWAPAIGEFALNDTTMGRVTELGAIKDLKWKQPVFVKPTSDLKAFAGMVVEIGETVAERLAMATQDSSLSDEQPVLWAPHQEIICEYRCYMRGRTMIEASRYRTGLRADHKAVDEIERSHLRIVANEIAERFTPAIFYAMDLAFMPTGSVKVVEYNCINCSGRYEIDRAKLFKAVLGC